MPVGLPSSRYQQGPLIITARWPSRVLLSLSLKSAEFIVGFTPYGLHKQVFVISAGEVDESGAYSDATRKGTRVAYFSRMSEIAYAFPKEEKEPISDASHVRNAIARFNQVKDVTDFERDAAWKRIETAAKKFGVEMNEQDWRELSHGGKA